MAFGPGQQYRHRPGARLSVALAMLALLSACATTSPTAPTPAPAQPSLQEWMQQAQSASRDGQRERARQAWRSAAKAYPTQKAPWQRLAEDYFDTSDYGNAILAAQEVLQRDEQDTLAHSVLAVSGLRLSAVSLVALRERTSYPVGSREEAMGLTRAMREALGETALVPQQRSAEAGSSRGMAGVPSRTASAPAGGGAVAATTTPAPATAAARGPQTTTAHGATAGTRASTRAGTAPAVVPVAAPGPAQPPKPAADPFKLLK